MLVYLDLPQPFVSHHLVACFLYSCDIYLAVAQQDILHGDRSDFAKDVCCLHLSGTSALCLCK